MEYLFGFGFTLFKIALQASAYATLLCWLVSWAAQKKLISSELTTSGDRRKFWRRSFVVAYASLFLFLFTYWGDHGLGASARLPIGHGEAIEEINGMAAYFEAAVPINLPTDAPIVDRFRVADDVLCGQAGDVYFTYDLATKQQKFFADSQEYSIYARRHSLPSADELQSFRDAYASYWNRWRFWLLA